MGTKGTRLVTMQTQISRSAAGTVTRAGFERMVSEVCLGNVGAVAAREVSRFARNSREWQQLVEVCRVVDTVLIDQETVYAPRQSNDRLLLGLKGSHQRIPVYNREKATADGWMNLTEAASYVGVSPRTLRLAVERGEVEAEHPLAEGPWVFSKHDLESESATRFAQRVRREQPAIPVASQPAFDF